jgi:putative polyhydroxyalkanoic acid system protein
MAKSVEINIPHDLGKAEARRRIEEGFGRLKQQLAGGMAGMLALSERWDGDVLNFEGGALGQKLTGRIEVLDDKMRMQIDLPEMLAALAEKVKGKLEKEGMLLLEKK